MTRDDDVAQIVGECLGRIENEAEHRQIMQVIIPRARMLENDKLTSIVLTNASNERTLPWIVGAFHELAEYQPMSMFLIRSRLDILFAFMYWTLGSPSHVAFVKYNICRMLDDVSIYSEFDHVLRSFKPIFEHHAMTITTDPSIMSRIFTLLLNPHFHTIRNQMAKLSLVCTIDYVVQKHNLQLSDHVDPHALDILSDMSPDDFNQLFIKSMRKFIAK